MKDKEFLKLKLGVIGDLDDKHTPEVSGPFKTFEEAAKYILCKEEFKNQK